MEGILKNPKVSFIVISHNFEGYIDECLESIRNQTYKHIEIIIVDDDSRDKTRLKIEKFIYKNQMLDIKFIHNGKSIGQFASFLKGLEAANGEFVAQIDGDDVLFADYAAVHLETHLKTSVALTSSQHIDIDDNNVVLSFSSVDSPRKNIECFKLSSDVKNEVISGFLVKRENKDYDVKILSNDKYSFASWHWAPATSGMMRRAACEFLLLINKPQDVKITSDKFVFSFLHLMGSSALIYKPLYAYRKHGSNYSLANPVMGSKKYLKPQTQKNYVRNNKLIRLVMLKFFLKNRKVIVEKINNANFYSIIKKIIFSVDISTVKGAIKSLFI